MIQCSMFILKQTMLRKFVLYVKVPAVWKDKSVGLAEGKAAFLLLSLQGIVRFAAVQVELERGFAGRVGEVAGSGFKLF